MHKIHYFLILLISLLALYFFSIFYQKTDSKIYKQENLTKNNMTIQELEIKYNKQELDKMVLAGGCFWCTEASFNPEYGVVEAFSGYIGGTIENPSYEQISGGQTGAREAVLVYFNPASTTIKKLLVNYWKHIDPRQEDGQFADIGSQYTTAIYHSNEEQKKLAEESKNILENKIGVVVTKILDGKNLPFYPAEEYHQDYAEKNPVRYEYYKNGSGRTDFVKTFWKENTNIFNEFLK
jgi:peptide-methionine (S)-S-oxide reductase